MNVREAEESTCRYAWLEFDNGMWHFLTSLCADPQSSTRRWSDGKQALMDLIGEGWAVVREYPGMPRIDDTRGRVYGYGLRLASPVSVSASEAHRLRTCTVQCDTRDSSLNPVSAA